MVSSRVFVSFKNSCMWLICLTMALKSYNRLPGRSRQSPRQCSVSANAIACQVVGNGKYKGANQETSRLVMDELYDLWRIAGPYAVNRSVDFCPR